MVDCLLDSNPSKTTTKKWKEWNWRADFVIWINIFMPRFNLSSSCFLLACVWVYMLLHCWIIMNNLDRFDHGSSTSNNKINVIINGIAGSESAADVEEDRMRNDTEGQVSPLAVSPMDPYHNGHQDHQLHQQQQQYSPTNHHHNPLNNYHHQHANHLHQYHHHHNRQIIRNPYMPGGGGGLLHPGLLTAGCCGDAITTLNLSHASLKHLPLEVTKLKK